MAQVAEDMGVVRMHAVAIAILPEAKAEGEPMQEWGRMSAHQAAGDSERAGRWMEDQVRRVTEEQPLLAVLEPRCTLEI